MALFTLAACSATPSPSVTSAFTPVPTHTPTPETNPTPSHQIVTFSGMVQRGENFAFPFSDRFTFELVPIDYGWHIAIRDADLPNEDLARLTPPFHFVPNPRFIEGWHFRNQDNTGPNEGSVNAPQRERDFIFSPKVGRSIQYPPTAEQVAIVEDDGRGLLQIMALELGNLEPGQKAHIESMEFEVRLEFE